jgi:hypothetical protein
MSIRTVREATSFDPNPGISMPAARLKEHSVARSTRQEWFHWAVTPFGTIQLPELIITYNQFWRT